MIADNEPICPMCGSEMKYYDSLKRMIFTKYRKRYDIVIRRLRCVKCHSVQRVLVPEIFPYKRYEAEIITGVIDGIISSDTLGFEDYPCEATMKRWKRK